jgi:hypothetical protein
MVSNKVSWLVPLVAGLCACSGGDPVDIGDDKVIRTGEKLSDYAASWEGYGEAFQFDSGSDSIRIVLDENGEGTLNVGDAPALPPPTDPDVGYPPGGVGAPEIGYPAPPGGLFSGFSYTVRGAVVEDRRIRLGVNPQETFKEWCEMQTPILDDYNSTPEEQIYACVPNWGFSSGSEGCSQPNPDTGEDVPVDCGKLALCDLAGVCYCTAEGCSIRDIEAGTPPQDYPVTLDAALQAEGEELEGTLSVGDRVIVRMTRD